MVQLNTRKVRAWRLKFYGDNPAQGVVNQLFSFVVVDGGRAAGLLRKFFANGFTVRAAWMEYSFSGYQLYRVPGGLLRVLVGSNVAAATAAWVQTYPDF